MQRIITANGREFTVQWCGQASIDNSLRFSITGSSVATVVSVFANSANTTTLVHAFDEVEKVYNGFTTFKGVEMNPDGSIVVALMGGST